MLISCSFRVRNLSCFKDSRILLSSEHDVGVALLSPFSVARSSPTAGCIRKLALHTTSSRRINDQQANRSRCGMVRLSYRLGSSKRIIHSRHNEDDSVKKNTAERQSRPILESTKNLRLKVRSSITRLQARENLYTLPNLLTYTRLVAAPAIGYLVLQESHGWAFALFVYAGVTDLVDGWIARHWKLQTVVGSVVDPMADKILMTVLVGCLAAKGLLPLWLATLILGRDVSLGLAAIYYRWASLPPPKTFSRYWDFSLPSASVHPTAISKLNTLLQLILIGTTTALPLTTGLDLSSGVAQVDEAIKHIGGFDGAVQKLQYVVAATTLWSGASYVWVRNAVRILGQDEVLKRKQGRRGRALIGVSYATFVAIAIWLGGGG